MADDILSIYAQSQPDKPGVIDDKPDGTVVVWTYAELEAQSNRIALVCSRFGPDVVGGAETVMAELGRGLHERGRQVDVLTTTAKDLLIREACSSVLVFWLNSTGSNLVLALRLT